MAYDVFISHAWFYSDRYHDTLRLLDLAASGLRWFSYRNYSVPKHDPLVEPGEPVGKAKLTALLKEQIRQSSVVIVPAGMYVDNREWIQTEIEIARVYGKPVIALRRRAQVRDPESLIAIADRAINWNSNSLAEAIRELC